MVKTFAIFYLFILLGFVLFKKKMELLTFEWYLFGLFAERNNSRDIPNLTSNLRDFFWLHCMECVLFLAYGKKRSLFCKIDMESGL